MRTQFSHSFLTAFVFAAFGVLWVYFTDDLFFHLSGMDMEKYRSFQNWKGALFMFLSALLIFFVSNKLNKRLFNASERLKENNEELGRLYKQTLQQDKALKDSHERFSLISKATGDAIWEYDLLEKTTYVNDALKNLFGYSDEDLQGSLGWWTNNLHPDDRLRVISRIESMQSGSDTIWFDEYRLKTTDDVYKVICDRGFIVRNEQNKPIKLIGSMQDVTLQKRLQQELISQKIARQKEITQVTIHAQEAEKKQLSEELHDNINQLLATVRLYLDYALNNKEATEEYIKKSSSNVAIIIEEIRKLSRSLTPPSLGDFTLNDAVGDMVSTIALSSEIDLQLEMDEITEDELSKDKKISIYRIIQEQLNNILKHSEATKVNINLHKIDEFVELVISDNGKGFLTNSPKYGLGLKNIRNRAELYGGSMEIQSAPEKGCKLNVTMRL